MEFQLPFPSTGQLVFSQDFERIIGHSMSSPKYPCKKGSLHRQNVGFTKKKRGCFLGKDPTTSHQQPSLATGYIWPGKPVAVNLHQLYPWNQPQLPKKMVLSYVFQVYALKYVPLCNETLIRGCRCDTELKVLMPCRDGKRRWWNARKHPPSAWSVCLPWS